jgi:hypothetical protein
MSNTEYPLFYTDGSQFNVADLVYVLKSKGILSSSDIDFIAGRESLDNWKRSKEE